MGTLLGQRFFFKMSRTSKYTIDRSRCKKPEAPAPSAPTLPVSKGTGSPRLSSDGASSSRTADSRSGSRSGSIRGYHGRKPRLEEAARDAVARADAAADALAEVRKDKETAEVITDEVTEEGDLSPTTLWVPSWSGQVTAGDGSRSVVTTLSEIVDLPGGKVWPVRGAAKKHWTPIGFKGDMHVGPGGAEQLVGDGPVVWGWTDVELCPEQWWEPKEPVTQGLPTVTVLTKGGRPTSLPLSDVCNRVMFNFPPSCSQVQARAIIMMHEGGKADTKAHRALYLQRAFAESLDGSRHIEAIINYDDRGCVNNQAKLRDTAVVMAEIDCERLAKSGGYSLAGVGIESAAMVLTSVAVILLHLALTWKGKATALSSASEELVLPAWAPPFLWLAGLGAVGSVSALLVKHWIPYKWRMWVINNCQPTRTTQMVVLALWAIAAVLVLIGGEQWQWTLAIVLGLCYGAIWLLPHRVLTWNRWIVPAYVDILLTLATGPQGQVNLRANWATWLARYSSLNVSQHTWDEMARNSMELAAFILEMRQSGFIHARSNYDRNFNGPVSGLRAQALPSGARFGPAKAVQSAL